VNPNWDICIVLISVDSEFTSDFDLENIQQMFIEISKSASVNIMYDHIEINKMLLRIRGERKTICDRG
jgi:hypothetical protein